jgi:Xaa-Pro aminopeptidase
MPDYDARLDAFRSAIEEAGLQGALLPEGANVEYLTGVPRARNVTDPAWDVELLVEGCFIGLDAGPLFLLTHSEWSLPAAAAVARWQARRMPADGDPIAWIRDAARTVGVVDALGADDRLTFRQAEAVRAALPEARLVPVSDFVLALRGAKDEEEIDRIREAGAIAMRALAATLPRFGTRFTRGDFLRELEHQLIVHGSERVAYAPDLYAVGPTTSVVWSADVVGDPEAHIAAPASVTVDWGAVHRGYRSDIGRTVFVGEPPPGHVEALQAVRQAQDAAVNALRPGVPAEDVDAAARTLLEDGGYGDAFWIPSGHGIGLEIHEPPRLRRGVGDGVPERAVVTVEIAAWREGTLAAFWEDDVVVRAEGPGRLTSGPDNALVLG